MSVNVTTPRMGEGVEQVTILKWLKAEGDFVKEYEPLLEVETDKVVTEIPSPAEGTLLKILIPADSTSQVGEVLAVISGAADAPAAQAAANAPPPVEAKPPVDGAHPSPPVKPAAAPERTWISPIVARMAAEHKLDLTRIQGSGLGGRITRQDVEDYLHRELAGPAQAQPAPQGEVERSAFDLQPITPIRRRIAERMVQSVHAAPHVLTVMETDMSRVLDHLGKHKAAYAADGVRLTLTAYFAEAVARALRANPLVNASWNDAGIQVHRQVNIGMAVSLGDEGLIVPVIRNADSLSLLGIARVVNDLADRARASRLQPDEVRGGTFSLTNHGTAGSLFATPIITQPQTGILGTGAVHKRAVVVSDSSGQDAIAIRPMVYLSFVFDHRVLDGAGADRFLGMVKQHLESYPSG